MYFIEVKAYFATHNSLIRSDEGLITLETSAFNLYGGQFTIATQLINPKFCVSRPHRRCTTVPLETIPSILNNSRKVID